MWMCFLPHPMLNSLYDGTISRAVLRDVLCVVQVVILFSSLPVSAAWRTWRLCTFAQRVVE